MSDIGELNKQCRECPKEYLPDGTYTEFYGYVVCDDCLATVAKSARAGAMLSTSYHPDRIASVVKMMRELEMELETQKRAAAYWKAEAQGKRLAPLIGKA